jgi:dienelactone hydrolase
MKFIAALLPLCVTAASMGEVRTERIEYKDGEVVLEGYLVYDDAQTGKRPGVLVCHEWWGNNEYSRGRAEQLAAEGYVAFALDMYGKGVTTTDPKRAGELAGALYGQAGTVRRRAALGLDVLVKNANVDPSRVAAIGYCMGGTVALELARSGADLAVAVCFHGGLESQQPAQAGAVKATILVCNGAKDPMVPPAQRSGFEAEMDAAGADYIFIDYAGAVHAFTNPGADMHGLPGVAYHRTADERSWRHMLDLFEERFGGEQEERSP